jgi:hypothetical protein
MSWWEVGRDDLIGDHTADIMAAALASMVEARVSQGRARPSLQELVDAAYCSLEGTLQQRTDERADIDLTGIQLTLEDGAAIVARAGAVSADPAVTTALDAAFTAMVRIYEERWQRKPRLQELLETLLFVLGGHPTQYVRDAAVQHAALQSIGALITRQPLAAT